MALIWAESCDEATTYGWTGTGTGNPAVVADRYGTTKAWVHDIVGGVPPFSLIRTFAVADQSSTVVVGCAVRALTGHSGPLWAFRDGAAATRATAWLVQVTSTTWKIEVRKGTTIGGTLLATTTSAVLLDPTVWYFVEISFLCHATDGAIVIRVGEAEKADVSGIDTTGTLSGTALGGVTMWTTGGFSGSPIAPTNYVDDIYVRNDGTFLGDVRVVRLRPNANGDSSQWIGSDGDSTDNYQQVDNLSSASGVYNQSQVDENTDYYAMGNTPAAVAGEQVFGVLFKDTKWCDFQPRGVASLVKSGAETERAEEALTTVANTLYTYMDETKPGGGVWTTADLDAMQVGVRVKS